MNICPFPFPGTQVYFSSFFLLLLYLVNDMSVAESENEAEGEEMV